jgi:hypothetical protein
LTVSELRITHIPRLHGSGLLVAAGAVVAVPVLAACLPRWANRMVLALFVITSAGIVLTVPDVERVTAMMVILLVAAVVCEVNDIELSQLAIALIALAIMVTAVLDSGGRAAAIARAAGCFGVLLALPVAGWLNEVRSDQSQPRRPWFAVLLGVHCAVVAFSSRALIRQKSISIVTLAIGGALIVATLVLFLTSRRVATET